LRWLCGWEVVGHEVCEPAGHVAIPAVKVFVGVWGDERRVFQDTLPPMLGSGNVSDALSSMSEEWRITGRIILVVLFLVMLTDVVQRFLR
jgi:hypothetical protein